MNGRLNLFQTGMLRWRDLAPYNAVHAVRVDRPLTAPRLQQAIDAELMESGLTGFELDRRHARFEYRGGPARRARRAAGWSRSRASAGRGDRARHCDFSWVTKNCFEVDFTGTIQNSGSGNYKFEWDFGCDGTYEVTAIVPTNVHSFSHTFPCGGGMFDVCLRVTDPMGTQCIVMHTITVPSTCCGQVDSTSIQCVIGPNEYAFNISVSNPPGAVNSCTYVLTTTTPGAVIFVPLTTTITPTGVNFFGHIGVPDPIPLFLNFIVQINCICDSTGLPITCNLPVSIQTICCKEIHVDDQVICREADSLDVQLQGVFGAVLNGVYNVSWYVMIKPATGICPSTPWNGQPYQTNAVSNTIPPLHLFPNSLPGDLCVYAVVDLLDGPCHQLTSNIAMVQFCTPDSCSLSGQDYCYSGACIVPGPLTLSLITHPDACPDSIKWFDPFDTIHPVQIGGLMYVPTACLSMANNQNCFEDFYYTVKIITNGCESKCEARIRFYSNDAPKGKLEMDPFEPQFFCPNEDATLKFTPGCTDDPPKWTWNTRPCIGGVATPILSAGTNSIIYNVNQLSQSAWYFVETQNGVCPTDTVQLKIEVKDAVSINSFTAVADACVSIVNLDLDFPPCMIAGCTTGCSCNYTIDWYKDGVLFASTPASPGSNSFGYNIQPLDGNYYAVLKADCCPNDMVTTSVITIDPACEPWVKGPCFICDSTPVMLCAHMIIPPSFPCNDPSCTFEWFDPNGMFIGNTTCITVTHAGHYTLQSTCSGCVKTVGFDLLQCQSGDMALGIPCGRVSIEELIPREASPLHIFPNPTTGEITVEWAGEAPKDAQLFITDPMGQILYTRHVPNDVTSLTAALDVLPSGIYFVKVQSADQLFTVAKLVKE